tara:strand:- start:86 stop:337 length:252 start_codon:yes stop_codon:yes gene_type:complete
MSATEKYPEDMPWDSKSHLDKSIDVKWILTKGNNVFTFKRSRINDEYVYIQKNRGTYKAFKEYTARFTYQRLFDEGYLLAAVA